MAALAVNGLTGPTDPEADHELYFLAHLAHNPPMMDHDWNDQCQSKLMESLPLMRLVGGTDLNEHVDRCWMEALLHGGFRYGMLNGEPLLGYFPEHLGSPYLEHSEICEVADMVALGLKSTEAGVGDYWDEVDRWTRNMLAEGQMTSTDADWLVLYSEDQPLSAVDPVNQTTERVLERNIGAFAGWPKANDWYAGEGPGIMHCCTGNGTRALYYVWEKMLQHDGGKLRVNLLLNRASRWADVDSHIPYVGQVDVKVKEPLELWIRAPEWVETGEARVRVNGEERRVGWAGRYAEVGEVKPGDVATMRFPIAERTDTVWIEKERYRLVRKGNEVVAIDPPGKVCPLCRREHYRQNETRWRSVERFIPDKVIHW